MLRDAVGDAAVRRPSDAAFHFDSSDAGGVEVGTVNVIAADVRDSGTKVSIQPSELPEVPLKRRGRGDHAQVADVESIHASDLHRSLVTQCEDRQLTRQPAAPEMIPTRAEGIAAIEAHGRAALICGPYVTASDPHRNVIRLCE